ncbi:hypothetical protein D3C85_996910 [compost metagenome]
MVMNNDIAVLQIMDKLLVAWILLIEAELQIVGAMCARCRDFHLVHQRAILVIASVVLICCNLNVGMEIKLIQTIFTGGTLNK